MNPTLETISSRRSHRVYEQTPITEEQMSILLKAAVESPSARNAQPWHFTVVTDQALLAEINGQTRAEVMKNAPAQRNKRFEDSGFDVFYHAPTVIFISGDRENGWSALDCGIAVENIALAAESIGLGSVILGLPKPVFYGERAAYFKEKLGIPATHEFQIAISLGVPADTKDAHPVAEDKVNFVG